MKGHLLFLGTGSSVGVPVIGCHCHVCESSQPNNRRLRSSALLKLGTKQFLIDAGPDFRTQSLTHHIEHLDGVIFTHAHYDHIAGIDDLRPIYYQRKTPLKFLLSKETAEDIMKRFDYIFRSDGTPLRIEFDILAALEGEVNFEGVNFHYFTYQQGGMNVNGFRVGDLAYISDIRHYSNAIFEVLKGVKVLILSALRFIPTPLHLSVDEAIDFSEKVGATQVWLTHLSHDLDHEKTNSYLPSHIQLAYDGLQIDFL